MRQVLVFFLKIERVLKILSAMITLKAPEEKMKMKESNSCTPDSFRWGRDDRERHTHTITHGITHPCTQ